MKTTFNHWYNALAAFVLSLLGFSSCGGDGGDDMRFLYGTPTSTYHLKGNVTAEDGTPIKGIKAVLIVDENGYDERPYDARRIVPLDSAYTDSKGNYATEESSMTGTIDELKREKILKVVFKDEDGDANGGEFATDTIQSEDITIQQVEKRNGTWNLGSYEVTANGKMKKKK